MTLNSSGFMDKGIVSEFIDDLHWFTGFKVPEGLVVTREFVQIYVEKRCLNFGDLTLSIKSRRATFMKLLIIDSIR